MSETGKYPKAVNIRGLAERAESPSEKF